ncbi:GNAT family N-acetyltransferase [Halomonas janggokensis]|uniref:GNAT family N-acetyltransferase n=1 Tax=Vreelandella janggokensis TaxID=370767 RepID=A0ABT4IR10_9GAMM|nr:GNAT family N-acetyltransferase [Halomonas janggokensis]MCZ0926112.1 GNAT family N-acetyltransferase [Halomonas janggokensis]MCZ0931179.1 GNAT family N-acetyltransferase [Halomonas janggokensis]
MPIASRLWLHFLGADAASVRHMKTTLRTPEQIDYDVIASWISDGKACSRWAGPSVPFPFAAANLSELLTVEGCSSYCLSDVDNNCIGFGQFWPGKQGAVHIGRIIVSPEARGKGVGRLLCEKLVAKARESTGASTVTLRVYRDNHAARSLYSSLGFSVIESESTDDLLFMSATANEVAKEITSKL